MDLNPQKRTPGVHLEQALRRPAPTLETGIPAFLGRLSHDWRSRPPFDGASFATPLDRTAWSALEAAAGVAWAQGFLGFAVRGFFENGGLRCYIVHLEGELDSTVAESLDALGGFDLLCAPDTREPAHQKALVELFGRRSRYFLILDGPRELTGPTSELALPDSLRSEDAALYGPWIKVRGACATCSGTGRKNGATCSACWGSGQGFIPPSGHVAGVFARTDRRGGFHKAPANEVLDEIFDLQYHFDDRTVNRLNGQGINCLRAFPGRGIRIWGARTLASEHSAFAYVSSRRVFLTVARWLELALADLVFEPGDLRLWVRIARDIGTFLEELYRRGALVGAAAREAFYVKCDAETNPPQVRERGEVVAEVGLALARPSEFIVVRLVSGISGASVAGVTGTP